MSVDEQFDAMLGAGDSNTESPSIFINNEDEDSNNSEFNMEVEQASNTEDNTSQVNNKLNKDDCVSVSDIILNNTDKYVNTILLNTLIGTIDNSENYNLRDYIVYINTKKNIPCIYDCEKLYVPKSSVMDSNGNYLVESIEGRRSGFFIKLTNGRHLVMSKNFIYDILFADGKISNVLEYNRKQEISTLELYPINDYDSATLAVRNVLPKIVKKGKFENLEQLCEEVRKSYNSVDDINAMFKIVYLMNTIGA